MPLKKESVIYITEPLYAELTSVRYDGYPYQRPVSEKVGKLMLTQNKKLKQVPAGGAKILSNCIGNASILPMRLDYESVVAFYIAPHLVLGAPNGSKGPPVSVAS